MAFVWSVSLLSPPADRGTHARTYARIRTSDACPSVSMLKMALRAPVVPFRKPLRTYSTEYEYRGTTA